jgi:hypothetical protein
MPRDKIQNNKAVTIVLSVVGVIVILAFAFLLVMALTWLLPAPTVTTEFFASTDDLSSLAKQSTSITKFNKELSKKIRTLEDASNNLKQLTLSKNVQNISNDVSNMLRWLKTNQLLLADVEKTQQSYIKAVKSLEEDAKSLKKVLKNMPAADGDWMTNFLLGILWVIVFLGILVYLFQSPGVLRILSSFFGLLRSFKGFGLELNFAEHNKANEEIHIAFQKIFTELRKQIKTHIKLFTQRKNLQEVIGKISKDIANDIKQIKSEQRDIDYRCTIHVPDMLFEQFLCQLVNYEPRGKGIGRSWSIFYGIIGRTWRSKEYEVLHLSPERSREDVFKCIREYGMTQNQADVAAQGMSSFMCIPIKDSNNGDMLGVFYMDAKDQDAFGVKNGDDYDDEVEKKILEAAKPRVQKIEELLSTYRDEYFGKAPLIQIIGE